MSTLKGNYGCGPTWKALRHLPYSHPDVVHLERKRHNMMRLSALSLMAISAMNNLLLTNFETYTNQVLDRPVDLQDVNRLLELGKILSSILTEEELKILQDTIMLGPTQVTLSLQEK